MKRNEKLVSIKKILDRLYFCEYKAKNVLAVAIDNEALPFAFIIHDELYNDNILLSLTIHPTDPLIIADITQIVCEYNMLLNESFYIDTQGETHFGDNAFIRQQMDAQLDLLNMKPISEHKN